MTDTRPYDLSAANTVAVVLESVLHEFVTEASENGLVAVELDRLIAYAEAVLRLVELIKDAQASKSQV